MSNTVVDPPVAVSAPEGSTRTRRRPQPARFTVGLFLALAFACILLVQSYASSGFVPDNRRNTDRGAGSVPDSIIDGGPIIDTTHADAKSYHVPTKTIALTFDDGPDPTWTPEVEEVLRKYGVRATFFVIGSKVAQRPDLVSGLSKQGNEIGVHTFTHPDLTDIARWRRGVEYDHTQLAIANATGVTTSLLRFPYSSVPSAIDDVNWTIFREAGKMGYLTVVNDLDSVDWSRPGVDTILKNATPQGDDGVIVLMHDSGGDRSQTVAALDRYIPAMQARGFRFITVSEGLNATLAQAKATGAATPAWPGVTAASSNVLWRGRALTLAIQIAGGVLDALTVMVFVLGGLTVLRTAFMIVVAAYHVRRRRSKNWSWGPPVSVLVPAYNEKEGIAKAVRSLAEGNYPTIEVVVIDDGSTDGTPDIVEALDLPNVRVLRVPNGGKSAALNFGIASATHDLIVMVDADTVFEPDSLRLLVQPMADMRVGAVAGNVKVGNRDQVVAEWQHLEYVIGFNLDRRMFDVLQCMPTVPGAIGAFRRSALQQVGGLSTDTLAEDTDLTIALIRAGWRVVYEENARAWTEAPTTLQQLVSQRSRWSYGTIQAMWKHRRSVIERGPSGRFGRVGLPSLVLFQIVLPLTAPIIDVLVVYGLLFGDQTTTAYVWLGMLGLQALTAAVAFILDREKLHPLWLLPLQQLAYRQLMYMVLVRSVAAALTGVQMRWHKLRRAGSAAVLGTGGAQKVS